MLNETTPNLTNEHHDVGTPHSFKSPMDEYGDDELELDDLAHRDDLLPLTDPQGSPPAAAGEQLDRNLSFNHCLSLVVGIIIGTGIFSSTAQVLDGSGSVGLSFVVWGFSGLYALMGAMIYSELGTTFPATGGDYVYQRDGLHPVIAFLNVWCEATVSRAASQAIISIIFSRYLCAALWDISWASDTNVDSKPLLKAVSVSALTLITVLNCFQVRWVANLQLCFLVSKFAAIGLLICFGLWAISFGGLSGQFVANMSGLWRISDPDFSWLSVASAIVAAQWAYDGWADLGTVAGEVRNPQKVMSRAIIIGTLLVFVAYILVNISYLMILPRATVASSTAIGIAAAEAVGGRFASALMAFFISLSTLGTMNGSILTGARKIYAASLTDEFPFPRIFSHVGRCHTPYPALLLQYVLALILVIPSNFANLVSVFGVMSVIFYALTAVALIRFRMTHPTLQRPYTVLYPYVPICFLLFCVFIVGVSLASPQTRMESLFALAFLIVGLLLWFVFFSPTAPWKQCCLKLSPTSCQLK